MVRVIPPDRLRRLIEVATEVFIAQGYQRTQMEDVARALGVAKGTLYGYVESKAALFDAALRFADGHDPLPEPSALPLRNPDPKATVAHLQTLLAREASELKLVIALAAPCPEDVDEELASILRDLYTRMERNRRGIKLVDRCSLDHPELASVWFGSGRWAQHAALAAYLDSRIAAGKLRAVLSTSIAARALLETIAFWAVHRFWDPSPQTVVEDDVPNTIVDLLLRGLMKEAP